MGWDFLYTSWSRVSNAFGAEELGQGFQCFWSRVAWASFPMLLQKRMRSFEGFATTSFHSFNSNRKIRLVFFVNVLVLPCFLFLVALYEYLYDIFTEHVHCRIVTQIETGLVIYVGLCSHLRWGCWHVRCWVVFHVTSHVAINIFGYWPSCLSKPQFSSSFCHFMPPIVLYP